MALAMREFRILHGCWTMLGVTWTNKDLEGLVGDHDPGDAKPFVCPQIEAHHLPWSIKQINQKLNTLA